MCLPCFFFAFYSHDIGNCSILSLRENRSALSEYANLLFFVAVSFMSSTSEFICNYMSIDKDAVSLSLDLSRLKPHHGSIKFHSRLWARNIQTLRFVNKSQRFCCRCIIFFPVRLTFFFQVRK